MTKQLTPSRLTARLIRAIGDRIAPRGKGEGRLCILNYHRVLEEPDPLLESEPDIHAFHWQMEVLAECFNVMPLPDALECMENDSLPPRAVCISFDDGYRSVHDFALPILKKFNLFATVFVTTDYIDGGVMWNDQIIKAIQHLPSGHLDLRDMGLGLHYVDSVTDRQTAMRKLTDQSKYLRPKVRDDLAQRLKAMVDVRPKDALMLTREMIANLVNAGIDIGAHTITHPILTSLDNESARHEIHGSKQYLEMLTGRPVRLFAYPNGKVGVDFDERHVQMARDAGFSAAFTTSAGAATSKHDRFQLPRSRPWDTTPARFGFRLLQWLAG